MAEQPGIGPRKMGADALLKRKCSCGSSYWEVGEGLFVCPWALRHLVEPDQLELALELGELAASG